MNNRIRALIIQYFNWIKKFHYTCCVYGAGLTACVCEIVSRTEQYFCPIKHAQKILDTPRRYLDFFKYGDAEDYAKKLEAFRVRLGIK